MTGQPTETEIFGSPPMLAAWVSRFVLENKPLDDYYTYLPDEASRKAFNITFAQRERFIREMPLLRIVGISLYIKRAFPDAFWLTFSRSIYPLLANYLTSDAYGTTVAEVAEAVEDYVAAAEARDEEKVATLYMRRVYDDSDHYLKMKMGGIGFMAVGWLMDSYQIFENAHRQIQGAPPK